MSIESIGRQELNPIEIYNRGESGAFYNNELLRTPLFKR